MPFSQKNLAIDTTVYPPLQHYTCDAKFSWASECSHLFSSRSMHIFNWPVFLFRQRHFNASPLFQSCKSLPGFSGLWKTIQKGSFAYNSLFLGLSPYQPTSPTHLADITTLALFFGDAFIDGMAATAGKPFIQQLVRDNPDRFCLKKKIKGNKVILQYCFKLNRLVAPAIMHEINPTYGVTYQHFHGLLAGFLQLINQLLGELPFEKADRTAAKIAEACNTCLKSFLHDVNSCHTAGNLTSPSAVLNFHELKTAYMQTKLLELRCILADKEDAMTRIETPGWVNIMRVIQIYDDIHDAMLDDGVQDNLLLSAAAHFFPEEWVWFTHHKHLAEEKNGNPLLLSLYMPCSMEYCLQLAAGKIATMNWEQQKIMHYLIFKNNYALFSVREEDDLANREEFVTDFYHRVKDRMPHLPVQAIKNYVIDTCIHLPGVRKQLLSKVSFSKAYQLRYNLLSVPPETKAAIFDAVTAH